MTTATNARSPRLRTKLLWTAGFALSGVLLSEVAARVFGWAPIPMFETEGRLTERVDDPIQLFENRVGGTERVRYFDTPDGRPRIVVQRVNEQRFRGPLVEQPKPQGLVRIACLGDSHTFGFGIGYEESWPAQLQGALQANAERDVEAINCGVNAYDTLQEVIWMRKRVLAFEPDIVVLQYFINDTAARGIGGKGERRRDWLYELSHPRREGFIKSLRAHSRVADLVFDGIFRRRNLTFYSASRETAYRPDDAGWQRVREALVAARDELAARDIEFAVALFPFMLRAGDRFTSHEAFEVVKEFCAAQGILCIDTESAFVATPIDDLRVSPHDYHANGRAHGIFARAVADALVAAGWI